MQSGGFSDEPSGRVKKGHNKVSRGVSFDDLEDMHVKSPSLPTHGKHTHAHMHLSSDLPCRTCLDCAPNALSWHIDMNLAAGL